MEEKYNAKIEKEATLKTGVAKIKTWKEKKKMQFDKAEATRVTSNKLIKFKVTSPKAPKPFNLLNRK